MERQHPHRNVQSVYAGLAANLVFAVTIGSIFLFHGAYLTAAFPLAVLLPCAVALWTALTDRHYAWTPTVLHLSLLVCALGTHWSLGGQYVTLGTWVVLAPQLAVSAGLRVLPWASLMACGAVGLVALHFLVDAVGPDALSPHLVALPSAWQKAINALNVLLPGLIWFVALALQSVHRATVTRQMRDLSLKIITLDVEDVTVEPARSEGVWLLQNLANFLKVYKAYLPSYLYSPRPSAEPHPKSPSNAPGARRPSRSSSSPTSSRGSSQAPDPATPKKRRLDARPRPGAFYEVMWSRRVGTLVYVSLQGLDQLSAAGEAASSLRDLNEVTSNFIRITNTIVKASQGVVEQVGPLICLISWNVVKPCPMHAQRACIASLQIQHRFQVSLTQTSKSRKVSHYCSCIECENSFHGYHAQEDPRLWDLETPPFGRTDVALRFEWASGGMFSKTSVKSQV